MSVHDKNNITDNARIATSAEDATGAAERPDGLTAAQAAHARSRREFTEMCARLSISVPPAVTLLASSDRALASLGAREGSGGRGRGPRPDGPRDGGRGRR